MFTYLEYKFPLKERRQNCTINALRYKYESQEKNVTNIHVMLKFLLDKLMEIMEVKF